MSFARPCASFSWSALVIGSIARLMTGLGNSIDSSTTGWCGSQMVSPVPTFLSPTAAAMSPAETWLISSRLLACILRRRPMRSRCPRTVLETVAPVFITPE